jgi:hypothetical protein
MIEKHCMPHTIALEKVIFTMNIMLIVRLFGHQLNCGRKDRAMKKGRCDMATAARC